MGPELETALSAGLVVLREVPVADGFSLAAARALADAGLGRVALPVGAGGFGAGMVDICRILAAVAAVDGSAALGLAMNAHVTAALVETGGWPDAARERLFGAIRDDGALVNNAATEERGGSPARGALPDTVARPAPDGGWLVEGEKTWTTFLPALRYAVVSARIEEAWDTASTEPRLGNFLVDLGAPGFDAPGIERLPSSPALGMQGSASGRLRLSGAFVPADGLVTQRVATAPDPRGPAPSAWFGAVVAAVYLGVGEGARANVVRWAVERRPGDGSQAVADIPTIQLRLGRLDAALRVARLVLLDVAARWDAVPAANRAGKGALMPDVTLAKMTATNAAVSATEEALRVAGGPGFLAGPLERAFRDARAGLINPPLDDIVLGEFGRVLVERERARSS